MNKKQKILTIGALVLLSVIVALCYTPSWMPGYKPGYKEPSPPQISGYRENFKTINGKQYEDAKVTCVEPDGILVKYKLGISKLYFVQLPKEVQQRFNYNPQGAAAYSAEQNAAMQKSSEQYNKEQAGIQSAQQQQQTAAALQSRLEALYEEKHNTQEQIRLKDAAPKNVKTGTHTGGKIDRVANPAKADLPELRDHRDAVEREITSVRKQLEQIQKTQH